MGTLVDIEVVVERAYQGERFAEIKYVALTFLVMPGLECLLSTSATPFV